MLCFHFPTHHGVMLLLQYSSTVYLTANSAMGWTETILNAVVFSPVWKSNKNSGWDETIFESLNGLSGLTAKYSGAPVPSQPLTRTCERALAVSQHAGADSNGKALRQILCYASCNLTGCSKVVFPGNQSKAPCVSAPMPSMQHSTVLNLQPTFSEPSACMVHLRSLSVRGVLIIVAPPLVVVNVGLLGWPAAQLLQASAHVVILTTPPGRSSKLMLAGMGLHACLGTIPWLSGILGDAGHEICMASEQSPPPFCMCHTTVPEQTCMLYMGSTIVCRAEDYSCHGSS